MNRISYFVNFSIEMRQKTHKTERSQQTKYYSIWLLPSNFVSALHPKTVLMF